MNPEEYFQQWMDVRSQVLTNPLMKERILAAYRAVYDERLSKRDSLYLGDPALLDLGQGEQHDVIGLGLSVRSSTRGDIPLALKLDHRMGYNLSYFRNDLSCLLSRFIDAADDAHLDPLAFVGVVSASAEIFGIREERICGILTEDVTHGKTLSLEEWGKGEIAYVILKEGRRRPVLLDPEVLTGRDTLEARRYLEDDALINF